MPDGEGSEVEFSDETALITGAAGNLVAVVAEVISARGARLVLLDLQRDGLVLPPAEVQEAVHGAQAQSGRIDVLCNLADGFRMGPTVHATQERDWDFLMGINARTLLNMVSAVVPCMLAPGGGGIVNVAAQSALRGAAHTRAYTAAKCAVIRVTESMAAELRAQNIRVNCVLPSSIRLKTGRLCPRPTRQAGCLRKIWPGPSHSWRLTQPAPCRAWRYRSVV